MSETFWERLEAEIDWAAGYVRRLGVPARDVDDVVQQALIQVCARWTEYDPARPLRPWFMAFVVRAAANHRRLILRRREELGAIDDVRESLPGDGVVQDDVGAEQEAREVVREALEAVDVDRRIAVVMVDLQEMSAPEVARRLKIPVNTMYSRLRLGRAEFVAAVQRAKARRQER
jgi:RNA polymerase sigma-70 factor (ECF subfamily)